MLEQNHKLTKRKKEGGHLGWGKGGQGLQEHWRLLVDSGDMLPVLLMLNSVVSGEQSKD